MTTSSEILQRMRELQAVREETIKPLVEILADRENLLRKLAELEEPYNKAYVDAEAGGWTPIELTALGAPEPTKRPKGRPRGRRMSARKGTSAAGSEASSPAASSGQSG